MSVFVISPGEEGGQPIRAGCLLAALRSCEIECRGVDLSQQVIPGEIKNLRHVIIDVPDFPAIQKLPGIVKAIRSIYPSSTLHCTGIYAEFNAAYLETKYGAVVIKGNPEHGILERVAGIHKPSSKYFLPFRESFPQLECYPKAILGLTTGGKEERFQGNAEASRGCHHYCSYCAVFAAYKRRQAIVPIDLVCADVEQQVQMGAEHMVFVDADFLSARNHALQLLVEINRCFPFLTFEITTRVDHVLEIKSELAFLRQIGLRRITSSLEFPRDDVLLRIDKGYNWKAVEEMVQLLTSLEIELNPTFVLFNPWTKKEDVERLQSFLSQNGLDKNIDPIQFRTRLLLFKGSPLLKTKEIRALRLTEREFHFDWHHPDPAVEDLYSKMMQKHGSEHSARCCVRC